jgi:acetyltransferase-like isoleucine patch superfamily enzyme
MGSKSILCYPSSVDLGKNIEIGTGVYIKPNSWLITLDKTNSATSLKIGSNTYIGRNAHFVALKKVIVENDVLIADNVYLSDNVHGYKDISVPIKDQEVRYKRSVVIGEQSWLGENVCVIGASVGKHSVIGANSVVTKDIPSYCIAVGSPAQVIKKYDFNLKKWVRVNNNNDE